MRVWHGNDPGVLLQNEMAKKPLTMDLRIAVCPICKNYRSSPKHTAKCSRELQRRLAK